MNKINYDRKMREELIDFQRSNNRKPRILLHTCCAPCFSGCFDKLGSAEYDLYFYNPNIETNSEYEHRLRELERLVDSEHLSCEIITDAYEPQDFLGVARGLEDEPERGERCKRCFMLRLKKSAHYAKENGYDFFATTLTLSPLKNQEDINRIGERIGESEGINYLVSDFKKRDGFKTSVERSKKLNLYRQDYCGCVFSKRKR